MSDLPTAIVTLGNNVQLAAVGDDNSKYPPDLFIRVSYGWEGGKPVYDKIYLGPATPQNFEGLINSFKRLATLFEPIEKEPKKDHTL